MSADPTQARVRLRGPAGGPLAGLIAALAAAAVLAGCLTVPPAAAQEADREPPQALADTPVPVSALPPEDPYGGMEPVSPAQRTKVDWPAGTADAVIGTGPADLEGLPVQAGPPTAWQLGGSDPAAGSVQVHVADRAQALAAGINGLMLVVRDTTAAPAPEPTSQPSTSPSVSLSEPPAPASPAEPSPAEPSANTGSSSPSPSPDASPSPSSDPSSSPSPEPSGEPMPAGGSVGLRVDYRGFGDAYGGAWGSRLAASALPGCAPDTTAGDEQSCRAGRLVPFRNNPDDGSLSVLLPAARRVDLPDGGTGWVVAVAAGCCAPLVLIMWVSWWVGMVWGCEEAPPGLSGGAWWSWCRCGGQGVAVIRR